VEVLALIFSLVAIVMAFIALQRTGGVKDLKQQMDLLSNKTEDATKGARDITADALHRLEQMVRGREGHPPDEGHPSDKEKDEKAPSPPESESKP
jgi:hypothetical protein